MKTKKRHTKIGVFNCEGLLVLSKHRTLADQFNICNMSVSLCIKELDTVL